MPFIQESVVEKIEQMKENDPEFKRAFNAAEQEREIVSKITKARKEMGLTQKDFASMLGLKQQAISTFERVEESPSLKKLVQFADVLELFTLRKNNLAFYIIKACVFQ
jgi:DNA-binding XRE family transcriptional regulator